MKRPSREEYERAVAVARAAIREAKGAPRIRADRSPQAVLVRMKAKAEKGEAPTEADFGAMVAALAEQESRNQRGRGRPKGARADGYRALRAAIWAVQESGLNPYRNGTGPRLSQCDAIADAMRAEGFRTLCSFDAARRELVAHRRTMRGTRPAFAEMARQLQAMARDISKALEPLVRQAQEAARAGKALGERIRAQTTLRPETLRAIERAMKTRR
jgi:hypothetical protein